MPACHQHSHWLPTGAICVGKTNLDQFACGLVGTRSPYGTPPNAFDDRWGPDATVRGIGPLHASRFPAQPSALMVPYAVQAADAHAGTLGCFSAHLRVHACRALVLSVGR